MNNPIPRIGILTISDRASRGEYEDKGGPAIHDWLTRAISVPWEALARVIPDDEVLIEATLRELSDREACCLIITTGGTGPAARDVTPEATEKVCSKMLPGFGERMRSASLASVPTAILSRQTAGIRGQSLIINLPGKPAAIAECLHAVFPAVPYCIDLIGGATLEARPDFCAAFRPAGAAR
jgi:molybdopterin adenylyltransferase